jgi:Flp pilus assembly pilin Flp
VGALAQLVKSHADISARLPTVRQIILPFKPTKTGGTMEFLRKICTDAQGQDIAEYAVMLAVILVLVIGTVRLIGGNANNAFSTVASTLGSQ